MSALIHTMIGKHHLKPDMPGEFFEQSVTKMLDHYNQFLIQLASGSVVNIHDICFRLVESSILNQPFETIIFPTAVFDIHQHTELILKWNLPAFWIIQLVTECICHSCQAHFN